MNMMVPMVLNPPPGHFSTQSITALVHAITGGSNSDPTPAVGLYRSGSQLVHFMGELNVQMSLDQGSRVPSVRKALDAVNRAPNGRGVIVAAFEKCADVRDYIGQESKLDDVVKYLNERLRFDGQELRKVGPFYKLEAITASSVAAEAIREQTKRFNLDSVAKDFERAVSKADADPADAITSACATVESVCKCILDEMDQPYPAKQDIRGLVSEVAKHLKLNPGRDDWPKEWEQDIRTILSGLLNVIAGIGSLRTHAGDAHGRGKNPANVDARIARLAIHAASTVSVFYIQTWQRVAGKTAKQ